MQPIQLPHQHPIPGAVLQILQHPPILRTGLPRPRRQIVIHINLSHRPPQPGRQRLTISDLALYPQTSTRRIRRDTGINRSHTHHTVTLPDACLGFPPLIPPGAQPERRSLVIEGEFSKGSAGEGSAGP